MREEHILVKFLWDGDHLIQLLMREKHAYPVQPQKDTSFSISYEREAHPVQLFIRERHILLNFWWERKTFYSTSEGSTCFLTSFERGPHPNNLSNFLEEGSAFLSHSYEKE